MRNENTVFEWHVSHNSSQPFVNGEVRIPLGDCLIDSSARANDRPVPVDNKPVSANDTAED